MFRKFLNDICFRKKMLIIYYICIILPTLILAITFCCSITRYIQHIYNKDLKSNLDTIKYEIEKNINDGMIISDQLYANTDIYNILYGPGSDSVVDNYENAVKIDNTVNSLIVNSTQNSVMIYSQGSSIFNGLHITNLTDAFKQKEWYVNYTDGKYNKLFFVNTDDNNNVVISFIRSLNYKSSEKEAFIKIDYNTKSITDMFRSGDSQNPIYLTDSEYNVICSSFAEKNMLAPSKISFSDKDFIETEMNIPSGWKIVTPTHKILLRNVVHDRLLLILILFLMLLISSSVCIYFISDSMRRRIDILTSVVKNAENEVFEKLSPELFTKDEIGTLAHGIDTTFRKIEYLINEIYQSKIKNTEILLESKKHELNALYSQINPHLLFNIMEALRLRSLMKGEKETANILKSLSKFYRHSLMWNSQLITVSVETELVREYLSIQSYRFNDTLEYNIFTDENSERCMIPKMLIQILVENSCAHAFASVKNKQININISFSDGELCIVAEDNGVGIPPEIIDNIYSGSERQGDNHIGISNILRRLSLFYGNDYDFRIENKSDCGTRITIKIRGDALRGK